MLCCAQHITKLLFQSSNHFWITIVKFYPYQLSLTFPWRTAHAFSFHQIRFKFLSFLFFKFSARYSIFCIDYLSFSNSPDEVFFRIENIKTQTIFLFSIATFYTHQTLLPSFLFMYNLSTSLFGCNALYIVIAFLDFLLSSSNSLSFQCSILAPYVNAATAHTCIAVISLFSFSFDFRIKRNLRLYFLFHKKIVQLIKSFSTSFIASLFGSFIPSHLTTFTLFAKRIPHFFTLNSIPISVQKTRTVLKSVSITTKFLTFSQMYLLFTLGKQL